MTARNTRRVRAPRAGRASSTLTDAGAAAVTGGACFTLAAVAPAGHVSFGLGIALGAMCTLIAVLTLVGVLDA